MARRLGLQRAVRAAVLLGGLHAAQHSLALGLGEIEMRSFLNEPLRAEVELLDLRGLDPDDIRIRLAANEDFDRLGVERSYFLTAIQFEVEVDQDSGRGVIRLSTTDPVLEPYLDLIIEARWPSGRLLREYTVLVDPPAFRQEVVTVSAQEEVTRTEGPPPTPSAPPPTPSASSTASAGDTLSVRGSDLAPGEMPSRDFSAATTDQPSAGSRYMVKRDETLWQIASRGRPSGTSVQQAMLDIQRLNPEAFIDGNINQIKAGYIIYLPAAGEISSDDLQEALQEVAEQNREFATRRQPGVTAAATLRVSAEPSSDTTPTQDDASVADAGVGGVERDASAGGDSLRARAADPSAAPPPAGMDAELVERLEAMANRLDTLEQIVALKDQQIATLEQALREAREAAAAAEAEAAASPQPAVPAAQPEQAPAPTPAPQQAQSGGFLGGIPLLPVLGGLLAVLAAAVAFVFLRRRRDEDDEGAEAAATGTDDDVFAGVSLKKEALDPIDEMLDDDAEADDAAELEEEPDDVEPQRGSRGYGERKHDDYIDEGASGDALAEADIYIAYGRYLQAIELLNTAIEDEPGNAAYRLKLIELYVDMGEDGEADEQLDKLRAMGDEEAIARAEALVAGTPLGDLGGHDREPAPAVPAAEPELDLDLEAAAPEEDAVEAADDAAALELDLTADDGVEDDADDTLAAADVTAPVTDDDEPATLPLESVADEDVLDFSDESTVEHAGRKAKGESLQHDDSLEPVDFEYLQIDDDSAPEGDVEMDDELDLSEALRDAADEPEESGDSGTDEDMVIAEDADQMATKLDLARAYLDMGDNDGARVILEQVIAAGSGEQQQEARELLSRVD